MKHFIAIIFCIAIVFFSPTLGAQVPQALTFQAIVRGANGQLIVSAPVQIRISILQATEDSTLVYQEVHVVNATEHGRVNLLIGEGNTSVGAFEAIDWGNVPCLLKVEMDVSNSNNYALCSITSLLTVPYALYATSTDSVLEPFVESDDVFFSQPAGGIVEQDTSRWYNSLDAVVGESGIVVNGATVSVVQEHVIGEWFMGGRIVAAWQENGVQHGLIAANGPLPELRPYSNVAGEFVGPNAWSSDDGVQNSLAILAQAGHTNSAALGCAAYSDGTWYLPSILELQMIFQQRWIFEQSGIAIPEMYYWSSTEYQFSDQGGIGFVVQNFQQFTGKITAISKFNNAYAWPVKRF
jgi:uncharacterized membrane protein YciS (DUF1049 family)